MSWHLDEYTWHAYAEGRLDPAAEASVEAHVTGCARCREVARKSVPAAQTTAVWEAVRATIAEPALPAPLRWLRRLGVPAHDLVVVSAADSLLVPWAATVGAALATACALGLTGLSAANQDAAFLALAPLIPVLAVALAHDALDPLREVSQATPFSKLRLHLLRVAATLAVAVPATSAIGLVVPNLQDLALAWLLPSLGLTAAALVLLTWLEALYAGAVVGGAWVAFVVVLRSGWDVLLLTEPSAQLLFTALALVAGALLLVRTSTLRLRGGWL